MDRQVIQLPPGVVRQGSEAEMQGKWYESHLVRWVGGVLRPVGGWERLSPEAPYDAGFPSPIRATHVWISAADGIQRTAILCETGLYVMTKGGDVEDITPVDGIVGPGSPITGGYGDYFYNFDTYGTPRPEKPLALQAGPMWTLDNFGDDLIAMAATDGRLLRWKPSDPAGTKATVVPNSPTGRFFLVTPERHIMVFWFGDTFNRFSWCAQELIEDWSYADITSTAGFYEMQPAQPFLTAVVTRYGILAFTVTSAYSIQYAGVPYVYTYNFLGYYNAPVAGGAITQASSRAIWYASDGFWQFDGSTISPLECPILDWIQQTVDPLWRYFRVSAVYLGTHSEVWVFFPARGKYENTHYVCFNFDERWWSMGQMARTCGTPGSALTYPILSDGKYLYLHEKGQFYVDPIMLPYAQTGAVNVANGARRATVRQGIVDTRAPAEDVIFTIGGRKDRISNGTMVPDVKLNATVRRDGGKLDFRVTGRDIVFRIQSLRNGAEPWTFGQMLVKVFSRGGR
jgi:hypothetical protein